MDQVSPFIITVFWIEGEDLDPDEFTDLLGIQPAKKGQKGEPSANPVLRKLGRTVPETFWRIDVERNSYSTDDGIQEILGLIWERREAIVAYLQARPTVTAGFTSVVKIYDDRPVYELSRDTIQKLAYLRCEFGMDDIYDLRKEQDEHG